jgi:hypothetical protein
VDRHHEFRARGFHHDAYVFLRGVARDVNETSFFFDDIAAVFVNMPDHF